MLEILLPGIIGLITGNLSMLLFLPQLRRSKTLENEAKQSEEWKKLYENEREEVLERDKKIDTLYEEISKQRDAKAVMTKRNTELEVMNTRLCLLKCEVVGCPNRKPPTGY